MKEVFELEKEINKRLIKLLIKLKKMDKEEVQVYERRN